MSGYDPAGKPGVPGAPGAVLVRSVAGRAGDVLLTVADIVGAAAAADVAANYAPRTAIIIAAVDSPFKVGAHYICDGVDDQVKINAAIAAGSPKGVHIHFLPGTFSLSAAVKIDRSYVRLSGSVPPMWGGFVGPYPTSQTEGTACTKFKVAATGINAIELRYDTVEADGRHKGIEIERLYLYGFGYTGTGIASIAPFAIHDLVKIRDLLVHNFQDGIVVALDAPDIATVSVQDCARHGIWTLGQGNYGVISNPVIADCGGTGIKCQSTGTKLVSPILVDLANGYTFEAAGGGCSIIGGHVKSWTGVGGYSASASKRNAHVGVVFDATPFAPRVQTLTNPTLLINADAGLAGFDTVSGCTFLTPVVCDAPAVDMYGLNTQPCAVSGNTFVGGWSNGSGSAVRWRSGVGHAVGLNVGDNGLAASRVPQSDSFTRANSAVALGTPSDNLAPWEVFSGTWGITGNQAYIVAGGAQNYAVRDAGVGDCTISVKMTGTSPNTQGMTFRFTSLLANYTLTFADTGRVRLYKVVGGVYTDIGNAVGSPATGDVMSVILAGTSITVQKNGATLFTVIDATHDNSVHKHGLWGFGVVAAGGRQWDDYAVA